MEAAEYIQYDTSKYPFQSMLQRMFGIEDDLAHTHELIPNSESIDVFKQQEAVKTEFHRMYYESPMYPVWRELYYRFLREVIFPTYPEDIRDFVVQKDPSFRINLPNNTSIGIRDGETLDTSRIGMHCDYDFGHPEGEINYILPFTDMYGTNSVYVESAPNIGEFAPIHTQYGNVFRFWGNKCRHFNHINTTGVSRLSYDFRVMPFDAYNESTNGVSYHNRKFVLGDYYIQMKR